MMSLDRERDSNEEISPMAVAGILLRDSDLCLGNINHASNTYKHSDDKKFGIYDMFPRQKNLGNILRYVTFEPKKEDNSVLINFEVNCKSLSFGQKIAVARAIFHLNQEFPGKPVVEGLSNFF